MKTAGRIKILSCAAFIWLFFGAGVFAQTNSTPEAEPPAEAGVFPYEYIDTTVTVNRSGDFEVVKKLKYQKKDCVCSRSYVLDTTTFGLLIQQQNRY